MANKNGGVTVIFRLPYFELAYQFHIFANNKHSVGRSLCLGILLIKRLYHCLHISFSDAKNSFLVVNFSLNEKLLMYLCIFNLLADRLCENNFIDLAYPFSGFNANIIWVFYTKVAAVSQMHSICARVRFYSGALRTGGFSFCEFRKKYHFHLQFLKV